MDGLFSANPAGEKAEYDKDSIQVRVYVSAVFQELPTRSRNQQSVRFPHRTETHEEEHLHHGLRWTAKISLR